MTRLLEKEPALSPDQAVVQDSSESRWAAWQARSRERDARTATRLRWVVRIIAMGFASVVASKLWSRQG